MTAVRTKAFRTGMGMLAPLMTSPRLTPSQLRTITDGFTGMISPPKGTDVLATTCGGIDVVRLAPPGARADIALLYLHGGGYAAGSAHSFRGYVGLLASHLGATAYIADYRLAPEHPYPAALDDALAVYRGLLENGYSPDHIVVAGDSAGGGLTLALALALRDSGEALPAALGLICPWLDLASDIAGTRAPVPNDPLLNADVANKWAKAYAGGTDPLASGISPLHADLSGLPPVVLESSTDDLLAQDGLTFKVRAELADVRVNHTVHEGMWHVFQVHGKLLPASDKAIESFAGRLATLLPAPTSTPRVAIIGAGMSGLCMAYRLQSEGFTDFTIYEKAATLGGTWRENHYPGLTCDAPARSYRYSWAPNNWSAFFAPGPEIRSYFERFASDTGIQAHIRFNSEIVSAEWDGQRWQLVAIDGTRDTVDVLVTATGVLHKPNIPKIPGLDTFGGKVFHTARWDHGIDVEASRIAVIGTGSTGVQIVSALAGRARHLTLFQRTAQWMLPWPNHEYNSVERSMFSRFPGLDNIEYQFWHKLFGLVVGPAVIKAGWQRSLISAAARAHLRLAVRDPALRRRLTPDFEPLCKRIIMSSQFYGAVQRPATTVVTGGIDRIVPDGIIDKTGTHHPLDVIALATGFDAHAYMRPMNVTGEDGTTINEAWKDGPYAYNTIAVPGFPNFFMMMGPSCPVGNQALVVAAEAQADFIMEWVRRVARTGRRLAAAPSQEATDRYNAARKGAFTGTVWVTGCTSWYQGPDGTPDTWPWLPKDYKHAMQHIKNEDFVVQDTSAAIAQATSTSVDSETAETAK